MDFPDNKSRELTEEIMSKLSKSISALKNQDPITELSTNSYNKLYTHVYNVIRKFETERFDDSDTVRLNLLQKSSTSYGKGWIFRKSDTDRGMRLHETERSAGLKDIRKAIDIYFKR